MDFLSFQGLQFPDVPATARVIYAEGDVAVPAAAAAAVYCTGYGLLGGSGVIYKAKAANDQTPQRHRLLSVAVGLVDDQDQLAGSVAGVAAAGTATLQSILGLTAASIHPFRHLRIASTAAGAGVVLRKSTGPVVLMPIPVGGSADFYDGVLGSDWELLNGTAGAVSFFVTMSRKPQDRRRDLRVYVARRTMDSAGTLAAGGDNILANERMIPLLPEAIAAGERARRSPVQPTEGIANIPDGAGWSVAVVQPAGGAVPTSARIHAELVVAVWPENVAA